MIYEIPLVLVSSGSTEGALRLSNGDILAVGSEGWFKWLRENSSFRFESGFAGEHSFTARKHERDAGEFWYAYRKVAGKLKNAYLGKAEKLDVNKLLAVASKLSEAPKQSANEKQLGNGYANKCITEQLGNDQGEGDRLRWNVYKSVEEFKPLLGKTWTDWELIASFECEEQAQERLEAVQKHNHWMNSERDYGVVRIRLEKRFERILPAAIKPIADCITSEVMQQTEAKVAALTQENEQLKLQLQKLQDQVDHLKAEHESRASVLAAAMENVKSNAAGKLIKAVKLAYPELA